MNFLGKQYSWMGFGIFAALVLAVSYYLGTRTGKGKAGAATAEEMAAQIDPNALTYELTQYSTMADNLYIAMTGWANDDDAINAVMTKLRNKSDLYKLISVYGDRRQQFAITKTNLSEWFYSQLSTTEIATINGILSRNNISFEF